MKRFLLWTELLLFFLCAFPVFCEDEYFASNSSGMLLEKINKFRISGQKWYAKVQRDGDSIKKTLYNSEGTALKKWEIRRVDDSVRTETVTEGHIRTVSTYEKQKMVEECRYDNNVLTGMTMCSYDGDFLSEIKELDGSKAVIQDITFQRDMNSRIDRVDFKSADGGFMSRYFFSKGVLILEWHGKDQQNGTSVQYHSDGKISKVANWTDGAKTETEEYFYDGGLLARSLVTYIDTGRKISRAYDENGNISLEEELNGDEATHKSFFTYNVNSQLVQKVDSGQITEKVISVYDGDRLAKEEFYKKGVMYKVRTYVAEHKYYDDIYADGSAVFRQYYFNNRKISKEEWERAGLDG
ncbi:MAG: hypothetical protein MJ215_01410 [Spirochaetia bacterium]|nr:hypothetical protein [Spirochaetia bacterium]